MRSPFSSKAIDPESSACQRQMALVDSASSCLAFVGNKMQELQHD